MSNHYLIFERWAHSIVYFVQADSVVEAIVEYLSEADNSVVAAPDGSITWDGFTYPHPLAYIEANYKVECEWQIRELPEWAWQDKLVEAFCGESEDGPQWVIDDCREHFVKKFPKSRARAFLWYFKEGELVTFYRRKREKFEVLQRYYHEWDGKELLVEEWHGDYEQIAENLHLEAPRLRNKAGTSRHGHQRQLW